MAAILAYMAVCPRTGGAFFRYRGGLYLTRDRLMAAICRALVAEGIDTKGFTGHSFRIGAATTAALVGIEDSVIKMLGRWESSTYQRYLQTPRETLATVSTKLVAWDLTCVASGVGSSTVKLEVLSSKCLCWVM